MNVNFEIVEYNMKDNFISLRPKHPLFKQQPDSYACFNVSISELDQTRDITEQLATRCSILIERTLKSENPDGYTKMQEYLLNNTNKHMAIPVEGIPPAAHVIIPPQSTDGGITPVDKINFIN